MKNKPADRSYPRKLQEDTRRYKERQASLTEKLEKLVGSLETERTRLKSEVEELRNALQSREREQSTLAEQLIEIVVENNRLSSEYAAVEHESSNLASLYVASFQLHESLDRERVLAAIQEIVISLIGCEEFVVFAVDEAGVRFTPISSFGFDEERPSIQLGTGLIGQVATSGETYVRNGKLPALADEIDLTACH